VHADYGTIGATIESTVPTFAVSAVGSIALFDTEASRGRVAEAEGELRRARAQANDLRNQVAYEVQGALLDLQAAERQVQVASHTVELATDQQTQAEDRFKAGVANNVELVQAQAALAAARDVYIAGVSAHNMAKAAVARAIGVPEDAFQRFVAGETR
jgi:outer membrane protein TolC